MKKIFIVFFFISHISFGQEVLKDQGAWFTLTNRVKLSNKVSLTNFSQVRRVDFMAYTQAILLNPGIEYKLNENISIGIGYLSNATYAHGKNASPIKKHEDRILERVLMQSKIDKIKITQALILEQRFIDIVSLNSQNLYEIDGIKYANRIRYGIDVTTPLVQLKNDKKILFKLTEELRVGFKNKFSDPDFDQSLFASLIGYTLLDNSKVWAGYGRYYQKVNQTKFLSNDIFHISFSYDVDLSNKI